jgi:Family of unknown function (DUF6338)
VIPDSFLGLALFAASLGPGYLYLRIAEQRAPRQSRSPLVEVVELVVVGGLTSLVAALIVLSLADAVGLLDTHALARHGSHYLVHEPIRTLASLIATLALSYSLAALTALLVHRKHEALVQPGGNGWVAQFWQRRPSPQHAAVVTLELRDGRKATGVLSGFTVELDESREIALRRPIVIQPSARSAPIESNDDFLIFREADLLCVSGRYRRLKSQASLDRPTKSGDAAPPTATAAD